jgi:octaprenyl-diphosphate synthase
MEQASLHAKTTADDAQGISHIFELCAADMAAVDQLIRDSLDSNVVLIRQIAEYIIGSGGKRLRPMLVLLAARACGYRGNDHVTLAAIIEFIHTATLLHDDVVDESELRRGQESAHAVWGNAASVLVGDFLYSRSFQMMVTVDSMRVMEVLSNATNTIAEGEVEQLLNMHDPEVSEASYFSVIEKKTAKLFEAACQLGAVLTGRADLEAGLATFGRELGAAFQVADDVLDYTADPNMLGKNVGDDLAEGKPTLPLILTRKYLGEEPRAMIDTIIRDGGRERIEQIVQLIHSSGGLRDSMAVAQERAAAAREASSACRRRPGRTPCWTWQATAFPATTKRSRRRKQGSETPDNGLCSRLRLRRRLLTEHLVPGADPFSLTRENRLFALELDRFDGIADGDGIDHRLVIGVDDRPEHRVAPVQPGSCNVGDEELAAVGAGAGIRHRKLARCVVLQSGIALILEAVAWSPGTGAVRTAALDHEIGNDAMERQSVVISSFGQINEIGYCYRCFVCK